MALLLKNGTVITFDEDAERIEVLERASVLIVDGRVTAIQNDGEELSARHRELNIEVVDVEGCIVAPGFVNTPVHSWQSVFRTLGPDVFLTQYFGWLSQMSPTATKAFKPEDVYISSLEGYLEGLNAGVTSFVEHAHNNWSRDCVQPGYDAAVDSGGRVWWCYDINPMDDFSEEDQWDMMGQLAHSPQSELVQLGLSLDMLASAVLAPTVEQGDATTGGLLQRAQTANIKLLTMHHMGGPWPQGNTSPSRVTEQGLHDSEIPIIFSHAPYLTPEDMAALREHNLFVSITPESECHYGHGQETGRLICDQASLGVDTTWTFSGDMLSQARLWLQVTRNNNYAATLQAGKLPNSNPMAVEEAFLMATRQGGRALRRSDVGVLRVGAQADVVVYASDSPSMVGWSDPVAAIVLHASPADVKHVLTRGEFRKRDFELVVAPGRPSWSQIRDRFREAAARIQSQLRCPPPVPAKFWGIGELGVVEVVSTRKAEPATAW